MTMNVRFLWPLISSTCWISNSKYFINSCFGSPCWDVLSTSDESWKSLKVAYEELESTILLLIWSSSSSLSLNSDESLSLLLDWLLKCPYMMFSFIPTIRPVCLVLGRIISSASLLRFQITSFISYDVCLSGFRIFGEAVPTFGFLRFFFLLYA